MRRRLIWTVIAILLCASPLAAQTTGTIIGKVTDEQGLAMPGVTVTVSGPEIQRARVVVADTEGNYRVMGLPPGTHTFTAELQGFTTFKRNDVFLRAGQTLAIDVALKVGTLNEVVNVSATIKETPIIDTVNPELRFNVSGEFINELPLSSRRQWEQVWYMVPGVTIAPSTGAGGSESDFDPTVHGASTRNNSYRMNGFEIGNAFTNQGFTTQMSTEAIADVQIITGGADASRPLGRGASINIVTKSGGNTYHGTSAVYYQPKNWNASNVKGGVPLQQSLYQPDFSFGGPIARDKLWVFGSYRYFWTKETVSRSAAAVTLFQQQGMSVPDYTKDQKKHRLTTKTTYSPNSNHTIVVNYLDDRGWTLNSDGQNMSLKEATININSGGPTVTGQWSWNISNRSFLTMQHGYRRTFSDTQLNGGNDPSVTRYSATRISSGVITGTGTLLLYSGNRNGSAWYSLGSRDQHEYTADFTHLLAAGGGRHTLQTGMQWKPYTRAISESWYGGAPTGPSALYEVQLTNPDGSYRYQTYRKTIMNPNHVSGFKGDIKLLDFYVQDSWRVADRLSIKGGVRLDRQYFTDGFSLTKFSTWSWNPRISGAYRVSKDGRDSIQAFWGRINDALYVQSALIAPGQSVGRTELYDNNLDGVFETQVVTDPVLSPTLTAGSTTFDRNTRTAYNNEVYLSYTRQLPWKVQLSVATDMRWVKKELVNVDRNVIYANGLFAGYTDPAYNAVYLVTNADNYSDRYRSFELSVNRNVGRYVQAFVNYTYQTMVEEGYWRPDEANYYLYGNNRGWFRDDKMITPHIARANVIGRLPHGVRASLMYSFQTGAWGASEITRLAAADPAFGPGTLVLSNGRTVSNPLASTTRYVNGRSQKARLPNVNRINLMLEWSTPAGPGRLGVSGMVFNLTNAGTPLNWATGANDVTSTSYHVYGSSYPLARGVQAGLSYRF